MKKILALALAMLLVLAVFAGCAAKQTTQQTADTPADAPKSDPAADAASDTEQPAASGEKKTVKIFQYKVEIADQLLALAALLGVLSSLTMLDISPLGMS